MKTDYYETYEMLYADYLYDQYIRWRRPFSENEYYFVKVIRKAIDKADIETILRPDAKYFLIVNFHHLIVRPLFEKIPFGDYNKDIVVVGLEEGIESDINRIVRESKQASNEKDISGHQIMKTIDFIWTELSTTKLEVWG
jgi:hypothetical protein